MGLDSFDQMWTIPPGGTVFRGISMLPLLLALPNLLNPKIVSIEELKHCSFTSVH
jgi:hypothetical protein